MFSSKLKTKNRFFMDTYLMIVMMCMSSEAISQSFGDRDILTGIWHGQ